MEIKAIDSMVEGKFSGTELQFGCYHYLGS